MITSLVHPMIIDTHLRLKYNINIFLEVLIAIVSLMYIFHTLISP